MGSAAQIKMAAAQTKARGALENMFGNDEAVRRRLAELSKSGVDLAEVEKWVKQGSLALSSRNKLFVEDLLRNGAPADRFTYSNLDAAIIESRRLRREAKVRQARAITPAGKADLAVLKA